MKLLNVTLNDIETLVNIGRITFAETFSPFNSKPVIDGYLDKYLNKTVFEEQIKNHNSKFFLAKLEDKTIGYLKLNFADAQTENIDNLAMEIERIYVLKEFHGKKIGQELLDYAIEIANKMRTNLIWLGVWDKNLRAVNFYKKNGFEEFDTHIFMMGEKRQTDLLMKKEL
ncbi:MAG: GNAT family N-acetyltransferase [Melioribacteraceae bacterium]|nr:GNAT family N-acetyltransferase [Melioribacteraceae bacterium]